MELRLELRVSSTQGRVFERDGAEHGTFCPTAAALVPRKRACPPVKGRWGISSVEDESARRGVGFWSRSRSARSATAHSDVLVERRLGSELKDLVRLLTNHSVLASLDAVHTRLYPRSASTAAAEGVVEKVHLLEQLVLSLHSDLRRDIWLHVAECTEVDE